jgi:type IV secretion system protein VirD4
MIKILDGLLSIIFSVFEMIFTGIADVCVSGSPGGKKQGYRADFMPESKVLSQSHKGFCVTGRKHISVEDSYSNAICFGGSGSGKSSRILIPSILGMDTSSLVTHDPSGELFQKTASAMKKKGYTVLTLNYTNPCISENFNPLHRVKSISEVKKIAKLLVTTSLGGGGKDPFWNEAAIGLLSIFIRYVLFHTQNEYHTLHNVLTLVNAFSGEPKKVDLLFVRAKDEELLREYKAYLAYDSKMLMSIVATAKTALAIFSDPDVAQVTKKDSIDFSSFRAQKTILYINNNVSDMKYYSVLSSIFFEQFFQSVMERLPQKGDIPTFFLLDEASSLYLNILPTAISNIRKYHCGILQVYQSVSQLTDLYGAAQGRNILANSYTKIYMPGQPLETAKELEQLLGKYEYTDEDNRTKMRQLLSADEIRILKDALILIGNYPAIKNPLTPYYEVRQLQKQVSLPPLVLEEKDTTGTLKTIQLPSSEKEN